METSTMILLKKFVIKFVKNEKKKRYKKYIYY